MTNVVEIEVQNEVAILCFNRADALNALTVELAEAIAANLIELDGRDDVLGIVLTGAGDRAFCASVDLKEARAVQVAVIEQWCGTVCNIEQILQTDKPVIAALNGVAAGGGFQMALVSDLRVAHAGSKMDSQKQCRLSEHHGSYWMSLHLGWSKNQELSMTGRLMDAGEAHGHELKHGSGKSHSPGLMKRFAPVSSDNKAYSKGDPQAVIDAFMNARAAKAERN